MHEALRKKQRNSLSPTEVVRGANLVRVYFTRVCSSGSTDAWVSRYSPPLKRCKKTWQDDPQKSPEHCFGDTARCVKGCGVFGYIALGKCWLDLEGVGGTALILKGLSRWLRSTSCLQIHVHWTRSVSWARAPCRQIFRSWRELRGVVCAHAPHPKHARCIRSDVNILLNCG